MTTPLRVISYVVKAASFVAAVCASAGYLPQEVMPTVLLIFAGASLVKDTANRVGDLMDNGKEDGSFKVE